MAHDDLLEKVSPDQHTPKFVRKIICNISENFHGSYGPEQKELNG